MAGKVQTPAIEVFMAKKTKQKKQFDVSSAENMSSAEIAVYLNPRDKKFAEEYLVDLNSTQAAIRAGYKPGKNNASAAVTGSRLMRKPEVIAYRAALIKERLQDKDLSKESIALKLLEVYDKCMEAVPVMEWDASKKAWVESGVYKFDAKGATKCLEQLSKLLGFDAPTVHEVHSSGIEDALREVEKIMGEGRQY